MERYNPYRDMFITDDKTKTIVINNVPPTSCRTVQLVELTDECIEKIADAVARRLLDNNSTKLDNEDTEENWYDWRDENGEIH